MQFCLRRTKSGFRLTIDEETAAEESELQPLLAKLFRELMVHVANFAPNRVFVHAGVVGWQGRALLLPGSSFAGKTTLVAELVRAGAVYYSDEYAVLDECGFVHPYARNLHVRQADNQRQVEVPVQYFDGHAGVQRIPVSTVVFTEYTAYGLWQPQPISAGKAVLEMLRHTIPVQRTPARVMSTLAAMMEHAQAVQSERGEASQTARALLARMPRQELTA